MRSFLYFLARLLGDLASIRKGNAGRRIARRLTGRITGKFLGGLFR